MKKRILVLFADEWAAYSPTLQNLVTVLNRDGRFEARALCVDGGQFSYEGLPDPPYERFRVPTPEEADQSANSAWSIDARLRNWINARLFPHQAIDTYTVAKARRLAKSLIGRAPDHVIAIDPVAMLLAAALFEDVTFLSLEVRNTLLLDWISPASFASVIIQNDERYRMLFPRDEHRVFHIQNSHIFAGRVPRAPCRKLVYFGNIAETHGLWVYPDVLDHLPGWTLTLKGIVSPAARAILHERWERHLASGRLIVDEEHIPQDQVIEWLRGFGVGLCFYDIERLARTVTRSTQHLVEHFRNVPSGKLFNYYAAGVPVVANDLPGLRSVADHGAGLLASPDPRVLAEAVLSIEGAYGRYVDGCYAAAEAYDFARMAAPYADWLAARPRLPESSPRQLSLRQALRLSGFVRALARGLRSPVPERLARIAENLGDRPLVIYGAGEHTEWLLREHDLGRLAIVAYADGDARKHGSRFHERPVIAPEEIRDHAADVFVSSFAHEHAIAAKLTDLFGDAIRIHRLYGSDGA